MKVKMLKGAASPEGTWAAGVTYRVPDQMPEHWATNFVERGAAVWLDGPVVEAAIDDRLDVETADAPPRRRGRPRKVD